MGVWTGTAIMENSVQIPQKTENRVSIWSSDWPVDIYTKEVIVKALVAQLCPAPCDPMDSSVHGIL